MPVNRKHDIDELLEACAYYGAKTGRRISFEWALIAGQNDDVPTARRLGKRLAAVRPPAAPVRGQVNVSLLGEDLGSIVLCQFKPDGSAGTPRAARTPAHTRTHTRTRSQTFRCFHFCVRETQAHTHTLTRESAS